jgi:uncharacterized membrane protein
MLRQMTGIPDAYVFKALYQAIFAAAPVIVYCVARRVGSRLIGVLAAIYFMAFPTFFTDLPFLCRQEIALLFFGAGLLVITNRHLTIRSRQVWFGLFGIGAVLSHYSTAYILIGVSVFAWITRRGVVLATRLLWYGRTDRRMSVQESYVSSAAVGLINIMVLVAVAVVWSGPITQSSGEVRHTVSQSVRGIIGVDNRDSRSNDTSYSIFFRPNIAPGQRFAEYVNIEIAETETARQTGALYPLAEVTQYPTPLVESAELPLTGAGRALDDVGIPVPALNAALRQGAAVLVQVFVLIGFACTVLRRGPKLRMSVEYVVLSVGCFAFVIGQVMLPALSVEYGLLRAFQQSLFLLAPLLAGGSLAVFGWLGERRAVAFASGGAMVFFLSLTGVIPQVLGGYPPQLHLNNSGKYYDLYYPHAGEVSAIGWLLENGSADPGQTPAIATDHFTYGRLQGIGAESAADEILPAVVSRDGYVFLGDTLSRRGEATVFYQGDAITYRYPTSFLDAVKDLVFDSGGVRIYR